MKKILFLLVFACMAQLFAQPGKGFAVVAVKAAEIIVETNHIYQDAVKEKKEYVNETFRSPGATTLLEFSDKLDRLDAAFAAKMDDQSSKFLALKPVESGITADMKEKYELFSKMIKEHVVLFNNKMHERSAHFKAKFAELYDQSTDAVFPGK